MAKVSECAMKLLRVRQDIELIRTIQPIEDLINANASIESITVSTAKRLNAYRLAGALAEEKKARTALTRARTKEYKERLISS